MQIRVPHFTLMRIQVRLFTLMRIRIQLIILMRIRILLFIDVKRICDKQPTDPSRLHFEHTYASIESIYGPPWLYFEPPQLLNFDFDAGPDPVFFTLMWIQIQFFILMRIRIRNKTARITNKRYK
jgi:hypothetical protein